MRTAVVVLTRAGLDLARRLREAGRDDVMLFGPSCVVGSCGGPSVEPGSIPGLPPGAFPTREPGLFGWTGPLRRFAPGLWDGFDAIVAVMALGIVVRLLGPLARDKRRDPAVVAVDDAGRFAISVLGGHGAGANDLARSVAGRLGAIPVVTTASDSLGLPAVDQIGRAWGWTIERAESLTRVAAAIVRGEPVAVYQDAGRPDWWRPFGAWPATFHPLDPLDSWRDATASAFLVISDREAPGGLPSGRTLIYRPRTLVAGVGCRRGVDAGRIAAFVAEVFAAHGLAPASLASVATVSLKADEPGLIAFARDRGVPLVAFPPGELEEVPGIERPSERVRRQIGIASVAEAAALRASGADRLTVPKQVGPGVTVAVARIDPRSSQYPGPRPEA